MPEISDSMHSSGALADALQDLLRQLIEKTMGGPSHGKGGEPLRDVCTLVLPRFGRTIRETRQPPNRTFHFIVWPVCEVPHTPEPGRRLNKPRPARCCA